MQGGTVFFARMMAQMAYDTALKYGPFGPPRTAGAIQRREQPTLIAHWNQSIIASY